ncbi:DEAD-box type RNA helicase [Aphanomyces cochlioides]|nr:DEAD-box type RNA helicase [Aphanomyces cochlioides]
MDDSQWEQVVELKHKISPHVLGFGLPPVVTTADSYEHKWKKLCLEEFHANLSDFMASFNSASYIQNVCTAACAATLQDRMTRTYGKSMARTYGRRDNLPSAINRMTLDSDKAEADEIKFPFTHVVLDEAGAMLELDVIGTIIHGCKILLCVGDHLQLNPFTKWRLADKFGYNRPFLERFASTPNNLDERHNMMTIQYRMHPAMATVVSALFYNGRVTTAPSVVEARSRSKPFRFIHVDGEEEEEKLFLFQPT